MKNLSIILGLIIICSIAVLVYLAVTYGWLIAGVLFLMLAGWAFTAWVITRMRAYDIQNKHNQKELKTALDEAQERINDLESRRSEDIRRMDALLQLNHCLAQSGIPPGDNAADEKKYMESALSTLTELVGAISCSFVPVDEWKQPLPAFTHGRLPEPVLQAWASHLADGLLRDRCGSCNALMSTPGGCPLHPEQIGDALTVHCLTLTRHRNSMPENNPSVMQGKLSDNNRVLGVLHLYMPSGRKIDEETRGFLDLLLREIALGYESVHYRAQEFATMRQIQLLHAPESDLSVALDSLLDGLQQALETSCIFIRLVRGTDDRLSNMIFQRGDSIDLESLASQLYERVLKGELISSESGVLPVWTALPMTLPAGQVIGMLFVSANHPPEFHPRQKAILKAVASQAALLIENERLILSLEYKIIIQERTRLAREIHDGLAQTLAFLKLQSAQMQSYLAQGDVLRLSQILKENHQVLVDAYLETRQAIDNLRLTPQDGLAGWLQRSLREFQSATGIKVDLQIDPSSEEHSGLISLEIQAQLVRIVQETLSNVRKHAHANQVTIRLYVWHKDLVIEIHDDGLGFDAEDLPEVSRHGLRGMRERAELIGAEFQVISQRRNGTTVKLSFPIVLEEGTS